MSLETLSLVLVCVVSAPFVVFLCGKYGAYGALVGLRQFKRDNPKAKGDNDEPQRS